MVHVRDTKRRLSAVLGRAPDSTFGSIPVRRGNNDNNDLAALAALRPAGEQRA